MSLMSRVRWRAGSALMGCVFVGFALLQINDPDPEVWATAYLIPAAVSFVRAAGRNAGREAGVLAAVYLAWALVWRPSPGPEQMKWEYEKEIAGLIIASIWLAALAATGRRPGAGTRRASGRSASGSA